MATPEYRKTRKMKRMAVQLVAVNRLHADVDGYCKACGVVFPCATRAVMRAASQEHR
ncbi:hypothetical protein [Rhodococcus sp. NPDC003348]